MISFENDYNKGAHPDVLAALIKTNLTPCSGYGNDAFTESAKKKIKLACGCDDADVVFISGGTQTNAVVISSMLREYEGVIAAGIGHIGVHEAGAVECTGHKVLTIPDTNGSASGKISPDALEKYINDFYSDGNHEHMVFPGMVYISHPTEIGTLYTKKELTALHNICSRHGIKLYLDGARLGYGLMCDGCDLTLGDIAELTDVFYIGGTKVGALLGEAVVFTKNNMPEHFITVVKRHGALLAKGRAIGVQFDALFTDELYFRIGRHAMEMAYKMKKILADAGFEFYIDSPTNQQFVIIENDKMRKLSEKIAFSFWEKYDDSHTVIRFVTSWGTTDGELDMLAAALSEL